MGFSTLVRELNLSAKIIAVTRVTCGDGQETRVPQHCVFQALGRVLEGETLVLTRGSCGCRGFDSNAGFVDERPSIPGGYGLFLSYGAGEGFRPGERLKCGPQVAERYADALPKQVMGDFNAIQVAPYQEGMKPDVVVSFVTPDQLSAMVFLHDFRRSDYDNTIVAATSGCASLFRVPLAELGKERPKAVIGNLDIAARPYLDERLLSFSVTGETFLTMLEDTGACFFHAPFWRRIRPRIQAME